MAKKSSVRMLMQSTACTSIAFAFALVPADAAEFHVEAQPAATAIQEFARQADVQIMAPAKALAGKRANAVHGDMDRQSALQRLIRGTGLRVKSDDGRTILLAQMAMMQPSAPPPAAPVMVAQAASAPGNEAGGMADIVVTARKRVETAQTIPVAVTVLTAETIQRYDLTNLEKVASSTPQLTIGRTNAGAGATLTLRGIGSNASSIGIEQSVAVVVDGVYYGQGRTINEGFFDMQRLEILKGPQALFFGKNATAGVISITTASPTDKAEFLARAGYEFKSQNVMGELVASGPLTDTLKGRLALRGSKMFGGYYRNRATEQVYRTTDIATGIVTNHLNPAPYDADEPGGNEMMARATLVWEPLDNLTATVKASHNRITYRDPGWSNVIYNCITGAHQFNPAIPCEGKFVNYHNMVPPEILQTLPPFFDTKAPRDEYRSTSLTANIEYDLGDLNLTSVSNFHHNTNKYNNDADHTSSSLTDVFAAEDARWTQYSTELRLVSTYSTPINFMVGGYYQKTKRTFDQWVANGFLENSAAAEPYQRYLSNQKDSQTKGKTAALFGQVIWKVIDDLEVAGGVRYTHETKHSYFIQPYSHPLRPTILSGVQVTDHQTFNNWSPEVTLTYMPTRDVTIYAAYKTAYKSGGFSNSGNLSPVSSVDDFNFDPERAKGFEGGVKTFLFDRQLRFNVGAYYYKFTNLQVDFLDGIRFAFTTFNAGSAVSKGIEAEFQFQPRALPGLDIHGSANFNRARYSNFPNAPCWAGQAPAQGCSPDALGTPRQDLSGQSTAVSPQWTGTLGASYTHPLTATWQLGLSADARYSDDYIASSFGAPHSLQNGYLVVDASIRVKTEDDRIELALIGRNLTNRFYVSGSNDSPSSGRFTGTAAGVRADQVGQGSLPRTVQAQVTFRY